MRCINNVIANQDVLSLSSVYVVSLLCVPTVIIALFHMSSVDGDCDLFAQSQLSNLSHILVLRCLRVTILFPTCRLHRQRSQVASALSVSVMSFDICVLSLSRRQLCVVGLRRRGVDGGRGSFCTPGMFRQQRG